MVKNMVKGKKKKRRVVEESDSMYDALSETDDATHFESERARKHQQ